LEKPIRTTYWHPLYPAPHSPIPGHDTKPQLLPALPTYSNHTP